MSGITAVWAFFKVSQMSWTNIHSKNQKFFVNSKPKTLTIRLSFKWEWKPDKQTNFHQISNNQSGWSILKETLSIPKSRNSLTAFHQISILPKAPSLWFSCIIDDSPSNRNKNEDRGWRHRWELIRKLEAHVSSKRHEKRSRERIGQIGFHSARRGWTSN